VADITMCVNTSCPRKSECYRQTADKSANQSYDRFVYIQGDKPEEFYCRGYYRDRSGDLVCPKCDNNRQVWKNQITGKLTCHRAGCHTVIVV